MKLFHYTSRETALEHILPTGRLRFGRLPHTNDPREFAPVWPVIAEYGDNRVERPFELIDQANHLLRDSVRLLCLTEDRESADPPPYGTGPRRARMWAQYSGNHTGVCLCFDQQRLIEAAQAQLKPAPPDRTLMHKRVVYASPGDYRHLSTVVQSRDLRSFIESMVAQNPEELFFTKEWDWESETEYRLLLRGNTEEEEFIDIRSALEAVVAGALFHPVYRPGLYKLCQELGVEARQIEWRTGPPYIHRMSDPGNRQLSNVAP